MGFSSKNAVQKHLNRVGFVEPHSMSSQQVLCHVGLSIKTTAFVPISRKKEEMLLHGGDNLSCLLDCLQRLVCVYADTGKYQRI